MHLSILLHTVARVVVRCSPPSPPPPPPITCTEMPDPEILTGGGTVSCSASTPFNASYCLTITYSDGQHKTEKCKPKEVKVRASGSIQNIICNVTVFSNASVPRAYLQATKDWKTPSSESILYIHTYIDVQYIYIYIYIATCTV